MAFMIGDVILDRDDENAKVIVKTESMGLVNSTSVDTYYNRGVGTILGGKSGPIGIRVTINIVRTLDRATFRDTVLYYTGLLRSYETSGDYKYSIKLEDEIYYYRGRCISADLIENKHFRTGKITAEFEVDSNMYRDLTLPRDPLGMIFDLGFIIADKMDVDIVKYPSYPILVIDSPKVGDYVESISSDGNRKLTVTKVPTGVWANAYDTATGEQVHKMEYKGRIPIIDNSTTRVNVKGNMDVIYRIPVIERRTDYV